MPAACPVGQWGENCSKYCNCKNQTTYCSSTKGCAMCQAGFKGGDCSEDINECDTNPCDRHANCTNTIGTFRCDCHTGFIQYNATACVGKSTKSSSVQHTVLGMCWYVHKVFFCVACCTGDVLVRPQSLLLCSILYWGCVGTSTKSFSVQHAVLGMCWYVHSLLLCSMLYWGCVGTSTKSSSVQHAVLGMCWYVHKVFFCVACCTGDVLVRPQSLLLCSMLYWGCVGTSTKSSSVQHAVLGMCWYVHKVFFCVACCTGDVLVRPQSLLLCSMLYWGCVGTSTKSSSVQHAVLGMCTQSYVHNTLLCLCVGRCQCLCRWFK